MDTEWSIEAGVDDPVITVPWSDISGAVFYVDLAAEREAVERIPEAQAWPEVRQALLILNAVGSPVMTTKCDAWPLEEDERQLDFGPVLFGFGAYFDVVALACLGLPALRSKVEEWAGEARGLQPENARVAFMIRPALLHDEAAFATTLYVFGYGEQEAEARSNWSKAVHAVTSLMTRRLP